MTLSMRPSANNNGRRQNPVVLDQRAAAEMTEAIRLQRNDKREFSRVCRNAADYSWRKCRELLIGCNGHCPRETEHQ